MNKAVHVFVYIFLIFAGAALYFEMELNKKRSELVDRNRQQEEFLAKIARTVEKAEPNKEVTVEANKDDSPVEAKIVDAPEMKNVLEEYEYYLEQANLETFNWEDQKTREQLRHIYMLDFEGNPILDGNQPLMRGQGTANELLSMLLEGSKNMQLKLNNTRLALKDLREVLNEQVAEINKLKPEMRQDKVTIEEKKKDIEKLQEEKQGLQNDLVKTRAEIDELNAENTSLKDEVATAKDETEAVKEELDKSQKRMKEMEKIIKDLIASQGTRPGAGGTAVSSVPFGDKGTVVEVNNENMFAIVMLTDEAMKQLKGNNLDQPLPALEFGIKRPNFNGPAGEFIGRLRLRQEVKDKNYVICDILSAWEQAKVEVNDVVFAD
jgi:hypothetical protein